MILKAKWRQILLERRKSISPQRRDQAAHILKEKLYNKGRVLSFSPMGSEIDLNPLNQLLAAEGRLFLVPYTAGALIQAPSPKSIAS